MRRSAGILLPIFSLPSPYGIGTLGKEARAFADFLHAAGQSWWQILPVGPTGAGDSPYTSVSTFAGNPLFLDLEELAESGVLLPQELTQARLPQEDRVDYAALASDPGNLAAPGVSRLDGAQVQAVRDFTQRNPWAKEYALYQALRTHFGGLAWYDWPEEGLRRHDAAALERWRRRWQRRRPFTRPYSSGFPASGRR